MQIQLREDTLRTTSAHQIALVAQVDAHQIASLLGSTPIESMQLKSLMPSSKHQKICRNMRDKV
jgi:hypothetical protein